MKKSIYLISLICLFSCKNETKKNDVKKEEKIVLIKERDGDFSKVKNLTQYPNTNFVYSLEQEISETKNIVYAATTPYAWQNIKNKLGDLTINPNDKDLYELNKVTSHKNSLNPDEIKLEIQVEGNQIFSKAYFKKSLLFKQKLLRFEEPLLYKKQKIDNFGIYHNSLSYETNVNDIFNIKYYRDDNDFVFNLLSKDKEHEILIYKNKNLQKKSLSELINDLNSKIEIGKKEKQIKTNKWKYKFDSEMDFVKIPVFDFNIEYNYTNLENINFNTKKNQYITQMIYQRNTFKLDEFGAIIKSMAYAEAAAAMDSIEKSQPKKLVLDSDFLLVAKRKNSKNPYFVILNRDSELMKKFTQK